ncbi:MAG: YbaB/EbfC family nucleoid-associated protein [Malacoplasma sp.]|nr:YbaB/EbfC family nucleoid-associated protein [Malacoplasma sp.]MDE6893966.1 YbaB/EbfC family nucleoid-associated protein [Malacoplasma sp.]MDE7075573.1 YbaB/EbfC family nucleoid-associated protein [Malacoplasma sp.]
MNMQKMLQQAKAMQNKLEKKIKEFEAEEFEFVYQKSITIQIKGNLEIIKMDINKELIDPEDKTMLEEMIAEALNEAISAVTEEKEKITKGSMPF